MPEAELLVSAIDTTWVLIAAVMVFFMHAGFAMVESGFTRSKNVVNILMKNVTTIAIGAVTFFLCGFALMFGDSIAGLAGSSHFVLAGIEGFDIEISPMAFWVFQAMFAATCATIVSGAVAGRVKFAAYVTFAVAITAFIYPVVGHWIWGGGWLEQLGFYDFAGSTVVHSVGAWAGLIFAVMLGARLGKYGPDGISRPIFGHSIPLGALGVFILWFGWFGFNGGSTLGMVHEDVAGIIAVTFLGAAGGALAAAAGSSLRYGTVDGSLVLNGVLAGLVSITAGADAFSPIGALFTGAVAGLILIIAVETLDKVLHIDDPVGAISVHGICGVWGTLAVGLLALDGGLFYGGGASLLVVQVIGIVAVFAWTVGTTGAVLVVIKALIGLRVEEDVEIEGLDLAEHGMVGYGDMALHAFSDLRLAVNTAVTEDAVAKATTSLSDTGTEGGTPS